MGFMELFSKPKKPQTAIENECIQRLIPKCKSWKIDTLYITTSSRCDTCKPYNKKIYSLYGWDKKRSKLPEFLYKSKCPTCGCSIGATMQMK